jgi:hypothetical protein
LNRIASDWETPFPLLGPGHSPAHFQADPLKVQLDGASRARVRGCQPVTADVASESGSTLNKVEPVLAQTHCESFRLKNHRKHLANLRIGSLTICGTRA